MKSSAIRVWIGIGFVLLLVACNRSGETGEVSQQTPPTQTIDIPGDMTYHDVLQTGERVHFVGMTADPPRIWLGTNAGLYASASNGLWTLVADNLADDELSGWYVDAGNGQQIYIGGNGFTKRSDDGGITWKAVGTGLPPEPEINSFTGGRVGETLLLFASVANEGIYKSTSGGHEWSKWFSHHEDVFGMAYLAAEERLYVLTHTGLYSRFGQQWENEEFGDVQQIYSLAVDEKTGSLFICTEKGVFWKRDGSWQQLQAPSPERLVMLGAGAGEHNLVAVGESAYLYTLFNGVWNRWDQS